MCSDGIRLISMLDFADSVLLNYAEKAIPLEARSTICQLIVNMDRSMSGQFFCLIRDMAAIARLEGC